jgi:spore maturation protein CgeB
MKILVVADWHGEIYAQAFFNGFKSLGCDTFKFSWKEYFKHYQYFTRYETDDNRLKSLYYKIQNKFLIGPALWKINKDLIEKCEDLKPDLVFIYRGTHIYPKTIQKLKESFGCKVYGYNNDDPFSSEYKNYIWRFYKKLIPLYDHIFSYRWKNIDDYKSIGYDRVSLLRSYYIRENNFHIENLKKNNYSCDVIFIGHFEDDGRDDAIKLLIDNNIDVKLYGTEWEQSKYYSFFIKKQGEIKPLYADYNLALNSAKIALVFLSKLNNDTYTRRCFEIPATKTMMMAEYTDDLNSMFKEKIDAEYFRNKDELLEKVKYYLNNESKLLEISRNGYERLHTDGHEVVDRCKQILEVYNNEKR